MDTFKSLISVLYIKLGCLDCMIDRLFGLKKHPKVTGCIILSLSLTVSVCRSISELTKCIKCIRLCLRLSVSSISVSFCVSLSPVFHSPLLIQIAVRDTMAKWLAWCTVNREVDCSNPRHVFEMSAQLPTLSQLSSNEYTDRTLSTEDQVIRDNAGQ